MRGRVSLTALRWAVKTTSPREPQEREKERDAKSSVQAVLEVHALCTHSSLGQGDFMQWNYDIFEQQRLVVRISKQLFHWGDTYVLDVVK